MTRILTLLLLIGGLAGCATSSPPPAPPHLGRTIAVLPPNNLTGDPLVVIGSGLIDRYVRRAAQLTVADVLLSEARFQLQQKGFEVADWQKIDNSLKGRIPATPGAAAALAAQIGLHGPVLYLEIRRWEADAPMHPAFVIVGVSASVVDVSSARVVWQHDRKPAPVPTPGEIRIEAAYVTAARKVMAETLAPLQPE
jgi:hypothetical protein